MTLMSLTAYAATHDATRQAAKKWERKGLLVFADDLIDVAATDANMEAAAMGRFRVRAHGGRRTPGLRGVIDRPALNAPMPRGEAPDPWLAWHPPGNPSTLATSIADAVDGDENEVLAELLDTLRFQAWQDERIALGWIAWPAIIASGLAAELGIPGRARDLRTALERHVSTRLGRIGPSPAELDRSLDPE